MKIKITFTILFLITCFTVFSQSNKIVEEPRLFTKFQLSYDVKKFSGNNFLSKAHNSSFKGFHFSFLIIEFKKIGLGVSYETNGSGTIAHEKVGNFNSIGLNHYAGFITYELDIAKSKFSIAPKFEIGDCKAKQKGDDFYAMSNGDYFGFSSRINYNLSREFALYTSIGYNFYKFNVNTTTEAKSFFNKSNSLNLSLGIQFL